MFCFDNRLSMLLLVAIFIFGFFAEFIDGVAGMGYGVTSSALLITLGIYPVIVSASVHTAEIFTTLTASISHTKLKNVDWNMFTSLSICGVIGGVIGTYVLTNLPYKIIFLVVSCILICMGILILARFLSKKEIKIKKQSNLKLCTIGFIAALIDAIGGGGWGPVSTTTLILNGAEPKKAIGTINTAEFFVTVAIAITFILTLTYVEWSVVIPLVIGGVIAAPISAYLCGKINRKYLGTIVGFLIIITMSYKLLCTFAT